MENCKSIMEITNETPVVMLTVGQLKEVLKSGEDKPSQLTQLTPERKYVYGLAGVRKLFNCSHATAQKYKDGVIKDAVRQVGRKIIVDADKAMELFNEYKLLK